MCWLRLFWRVILGKVLCWIKFRILLIRVWMVCLIFGFFWSSGWICYRLIGVILRSWLNVLKGRFFVFFCVIRSILNYCGSLFLLFLMGLWILLSLWWLIMGLIWIVLLLMNLFMMRLAELLILIKIIFCLEMVVN